MITLMAVIAIGMLVLVAYFAFVEEINDDEDDFY
jgi:hypothetical protein